MSLKQVKQVKNVALGLTIGIISTLAITKFAERYANSVKEKEQIKKEIENSVKEKEQIKKEIQSIQYELNVGDMCWDYDKDFIWTILKNSKNKQIQTLLRHLKKADFGNGSMQSSDKDVIYERYKILMDNSTEGRMVHLGDICGIYFSHDEIFEDVPDEVPTLLTIIFNAGSKNAPNLFKALYDRRKSDKDFIARLKIFEKEYIAACARSGYMYGIEKVLEEEYEKNKEEFFKEATNAKNAAIFNLKTKTSGL
jgi:hypothetical protein